MTGDVAVSKPRPFQTLFDTIVAPRAAFEAIRTAPTWFWALLVSIALMTIASYLVTPTTEHVMLNDPVGTFGPRYAQASPEMQQRMLEAGKSIAAFNFLGVVFVAPILVLLETLVMLVFNALGRGEATFKHLWSAASNMLIVAALGSLFSTVLILVRGVQSFSTMRSIQFAIPSLGLIVPESAVKLHAAFSAVTPFSLWGAALVAVAMLFVARVPSLQAWLCALINLVIPMLFAAAFAH